MSNLKVPSTSADRSRTTIEWAHQQLDILQSTQQVRSLLLVALTADGTLAVRYSDNISTLEAVGMLELSKSLFTARADEEWVPAEDAPPTAPTEPA